MKARLSVFVAALWWGSLTTLGFFVVPMLFSYLPTPALAGNMAAKLFAAQTWVSVSCGLLLLLIFRSKFMQNKAVSGVKYDSAAILFIVAGILLALLVAFGVSPRIVAREDLKFWHALGSVMYVLQWVCAGMVLHKLSAPSELTS